MTNKTIQSLINKSNKGSLEASYQLYENYLNGKHVEIDEDTANLYKKRTIDIFRKNKLILTDIKLLNYKRFKELTINFSPKTTIIIGNNGTGKTTILDSISKSLSWLSGKITSSTSGGRGQLINEMEINNHVENDEYTTIVSSFETAKKQKHSIELFKSRNATTLSQRSQVDAFTTLAKLYKLLNTENDNASLPLLAFYSVHRSSEISLSDSDTQTVNSNLFDKKLGYEKSLNGKIDFQNFFKWFSYIYDLSLETKTKNNSDDINKKIIELLKDNSLDKLRSELQRITESASLNSPNNDVATKIVNSINTAITSFIPELSNIKLTRIPKLDLSIEKNGIPLSVLQLSQGEKSLIFLISDIARRLTILNPESDNPLLGSGIVLIDEIDLHLHPKWQQSVIKNLENTFKNIQFIITTHSPQVLSTIKKENIRILDIDIEDNDIAAIPISHTYGEASNYILKSVMNVDPTPPTEENKKLKKLMSYVDQGDHETEGALDLLKELELSLGDTHSQIQAIKRSIRRQKALNQ